MRFCGITVILWRWHPRYWMFRSWGPWSLAKSYALAFGPLFVERYFEQRVEDGAGLPGPKWIIGNNRDRSRR